LRGLLTAPRLRWSAPRWDRIGDELVRTTISRLGKTAEHIVDLLERAGGTLELEALAEALDVTRPRDLRRRVISRLERAEVVVVGAETVSLTLDWLEALNREREISGEIDAYRRDMQRYAREREAYATQHHRKPDRAPSQEEMDAKREHAEREERELTEDEERDADAILEFERHYGPFLWNSASAKRLFYRTGRWPDAETLQKLRDYLGVTHEAV